MNFGKKSTQRKRKVLNSNSSRMGNKALIIFLRTFFFSLVAVCSIVFCMGIGSFRAIIDNSPDISQVNIMPIGNATFIYDADGNQMQKLSAPTANRMSVSINKIPLHMQHAIVAIEDERFYEHNGIDVRGILRAFINGVSHGFHFNEGASTLTQQLLKNNVFTNWTNEGKIERFKRKFQEQYLALQLEAALTADGKDTKSVILENYLNTINLSAGTYGVQAAAQRYFGKNSEDLTLSECAVLAAIPQNPYAFNPIRHPEKNAERRQKVLTNMLEQGYISNAEYQEALNDNVYERIQETDSMTAVSAPYSYFIDELTSQIINDLQTQKGYTKVQAQTALYSGGLQVYTTQDPHIQQIMDEEYQNEENFPENIQYGLDWALTVEKSDGSTQNYSKEMLSLYFRNKDEQFDLLFDTEEEGISYVEEYKKAVVEPGEKIIAERISFMPQPQSSMVIIDQSTGYVKALVGGRGKKTASLTLNRATSTYRQPGSTFKPLAVYGPAINDLNLTLADKYNDEMITYEDSSRPVKNAYNDYRGPMSIREAIKVSCNTVAVKCFRDLTPETGYKYLKRLGFDKVTDHAVINGQVFSDVGEPTALGGITIGVSTLELTAAYAAIANGGLYTKPIFYTKILDQDGEVLLENHPETDQIFKPSTAFLLTSAMESVVNEAGGTGNAMRLDNMPVSGKTGTTSATRDVWFAGFTPYYTCAVWAGYDSMELLKEDSKSFHTTLWHNVMSRIHSDLPKAEFKRPDNVQQVTICSQSGLLSGLGCVPRKEWFVDSTVPKSRCTQHYVPPTPEPTPVPTATPTPEATETPSPTLTPKPTQSVPTTPPAPTSSALEVPDETAASEPSGSPVERFSLDHE